MKHRHVILNLSLILVLASLLLLTACVSRSTARSVSNVTRTLNDASDTETFTLDVSPVADSVDLQMRCNLTSGTVHWTLTDPQGDVRWEETGTRKEQASRHFQTIAGEWVLDVTTETANGKYSMEWEAIGTELGSKR
jgi:uncharacterized lipoprotein YajG